MDNIDVDNSDGELEIEVENKKQIMDNWSNAMTDDVMAKKKLARDWKKYQASIAAQKAAFAKTAKAQWPKKFQAYADSLKKFDKQVYHFDWDKMDKHGKYMHEHIHKQMGGQPQPQTLVTDNQQFAAE